MVHLIIQDNVISKSLITSAKILLENKVTFTGYGIECGRILWGPPFHLLQCELKIPDTKDSGFLVLLFHRPLTAPALPIVSFFSFCVSAHLSNLAGVGEVGFLGTVSTFSGWSPNKLFEPDLDFCSVLITEQLYCDRKAVRGQC